MNGRMVAVSALNARRTALLATLVVGAAVVVGASQATSPKAAVDELLTADVTFSAAAATRDLITGITAMMSPDVILAVPGRGYVRGPNELAAALQRDTLNATSRAVWSPIRGGVSADGRHGFTYGYMTVTRRDGTRVPLKYLAYWVKGAEGWRVAAYKRGRRPAGDVSTEMLAPALPALLVAVTTDATTLEAHRTTLMKAEKDFSDDAQVMGVGPAFTKWGSADAMNMGSPDDASFVIGNVEIGAKVGGPDPKEKTTINWSSDHVIVASSGDLGVSLGFIRQNTPPAAGAPGGAQGLPFFTIWRRAGPGAPWRYVAE